MRLLKDLNVKLRWNRNTGSCYEKIENFPLKNNMKADFLVRVNVFKNVDNRNYFDLFRVDVEDLKVFNSSNDYVFLRKNQDKELVKDIKNRILIS